MSNKDILKTLKTANDAPENPFELFDIWYREAEKKEPCDPNAMCLSTIDQNGFPQSRIVLLKGHNENGFFFFTNYSSSKGHELATTPRASLNFYWKSLGKQIRVVGTVAKLDESVSDAYFKTRQKGSQLGAWASQQSSILKSRSELESRVQEMSDKYKDHEEIPRPPHWGGYCLSPNSLEFWHAGDYRLHTRVLYLQDDVKWKKEMLFP